MVELENMNYITCTTKISKDYILTRAAPSAFQKLEAMLFFGAAAI
jgi:hypothetical protein